MRPLLDVSELRVHFPRRAGTTWRRDHRVVRAVDGVSLTVGRGETLGLVGESGCGKSTLGRAILRLVPATSGSVRFDGQELAGLSRAQLATLRPRMQLVFQDAGAPLNPRWRIGRLIGEPLEIHRHLAGSTLRRKVDSLLETVGLDVALGARLPRELSGGQRQRVGIARALALEPELLVCDEPTSALDLSIQAQIVALLKDLQRRLGLSYLLITHDLGVVRQISDRVAVMYLGKVVECAARDQLFDCPRHPYTQALLSAVPIPDPQRARQARSVAVGGEVPSPSAPPAGCNFCTRCAFKSQAMLEHAVDCDTQEPELIEPTPGHQVACHLHT
ncbi:MAG TPA: oligopeptide/dipeptide ABC transporter ATP-binding protein [Acidobacteriota bacterium]|nr:oligopeptide/dipeptide ABC transporter ATP-binding protein [Acidobacteriota bacterium]